MIVKEILEVLEEWAPIAYAEDFDNVGLLVGDHTHQCSGIIVSLDCTLPLLKEAQTKNCNLVVCFHPILFSGLKKISGQTYVDQCIQFAIKNDISIIALHTRLDNHPGGVNHVLAQALSIENSRILIPKSGALKKLNTSVPQDYVEVVLEALHKCGAGALGNYSDCSFSVSGIGRFKGNQNSKPFKGATNQKSEIEEVNIQMVFSSHLSASVTQALKESHPYETVAFDIVTLDHPNPEVGMGRIGELKVALEASAFLNKVKESIPSGILRHSPIPSKSIHKVAVLGGSGSFAIEAAKKQGADAFITADLKYHHFFQGDDSLLLVDVGHYESEQFTKKLIFEHLTKKLPNFAIVLSETITNPVNYF
jgi:dinuclear metal center YbgI/SA1388 family protein